MSTLEEDLENIQPKTTGTDCNLGSWLAEHEDRAPRLRTLIGNPRYSGDAVAEVLGKHGIETSGNAVRRHRNGVCKWCKARGLTYGV